jgi:hypothetical protein
MQPSACLHSGLKALLEKQKPVGLRDREEKMPAPSLRAGHSVEEKKVENSTTWTNCKNDFSESTEVVVPGPGQRPGLGAFLVGIWG